MIEYQEENHILINQIKRRNFCKKKIILSGKKIFSDKSKFNIFNSDGRKTKYGIGYPKCIAIVFIY